MSNRHSVFLFTSLGAVLWLAACGKSSPDAASSKPAAADATASAPTNQIAWLEGSVDDAFAQARDQSKPVLLYWGARWCPPCNQLKATVFTRPEFIEQTRHFVAVHLDGDSPGAQKWGEYFAIVGYPTLIVLRPDRSEIMRLSGGTDVEQFPKVLALAQKQTATAAELRDRALKSPQELSADDWTLLANYGWDVDQDRLSGAGKSADLLDQLAAACPIASLKPRFAIMALATRVREADKPETALTPAQQAAAQTLLLSVIQDPVQLKANHGELSDGGGAMISAATAPGSDARRQLIDALGPAMDRVYADATLPVLDRLSTAGADIDLFHLQQGDQAKPPQALVDKVHQRVAWADAESKTPFERQAVISDASDLLDGVGDEAGAEKLLLDELQKSQAPYYYMPRLSELAAKRGDKAQAADWLRRAYEASDGPATRAQWGVSYVRGMVKLTPDDAKDIEAVMTQVIDEIAASPDAYYQRTRTRFDKLAVTLETWSEQTHQAPVLAHLRTHMDAVCGKLPAASESLKSCQDWLTKA